MTDNDIIEPTEEELDKFWQEILPDVRAVLNLADDDLTERCRGMARTYINNLQWSDQATEDEKTLVAGNINGFAMGVLRPLLIVNKVHREKLREERDRAEGRLDNEDEQKYIDLFHGWMMPRWGMLQGREYAIARQMFFAGVLEKKAQPAGGEA